MGIPRQRQCVLAVLRLPVDERGRRRASMREKWFANADRQLETDDILAD
jgi:hypothetical protein